MVQYRRNHQPNGLYFFTVTLKNRQSTLLTDQINFLNKSLIRVHKENPFITKAIVILPDHIHAIWEMPNEDQNYSIRWRKIKSYFSHELIKVGISVTTNKRGDFNIWQSRFWEHTISNEKDFENHVNYIHYNPVKHGLVERVRDWPYSSFHRYVEEEWLDWDWGSLYSEGMELYGE